MADISTLGAAIGFLIFCVILVCAFLFIILIWSAVSPKTYEPVGKALRVFFNQRPRRKR